MIKNNNNWIYVDGYIDEGITGTSDIKRNNFMKMIEDAKNGVFDLIITKEISRFSRNTLDSIKYTRELLNYGVAVLFVNDNINTIFSDSELRLTIMASMAQDEVRRLSERVKFGMNRAIADGHILGNNKLFGYNKNKLTGNLKIDINEGNIIKKIYEMYVIEDLSLNRIVGYLNDNNIRTSFGNKFSVCTLSRILKNPKYKGYYCGKKSEVIDYMTKRIKYFDINEWVMYEDNVKIPPLVSEEIWNRAYEKLVKRSKKNNEKIVYQSNYPLSGKIICFNHNSLFYRRKLSKNSDNLVWCCSKHLGSKSSCNTPRIRQSELNFIFDNIFRSFSINLDSVIEMLFNYYKLNKEFEISYDELKKKILSISNLDNIRLYLVELLLKKIVVSNVIDNKNGIDLKIFFNFSLEYVKTMDELGCFFKREYEFKRGWDTIKTKRYNVYYIVSCYI